MFPLLFSVDQSAHRQMSKTDARENVN